MGKKRIVTQISVTKLTKWCTEKSTKKKVMPRFNEGCSVRFDIALFYFFPFLLMS